MKDAKDQSSIPRVITDLRRAVEDRHLSAALTLFREAADFLDKCPTQITPGLLDCAARLLDRAPAHLGTVENWLKQFRSMTSLGEITMADNAHVKLAEAIVQFHKRDYRSSIESLRAIVWLADECAQEDLGVIARYYLSCALYKTAAFVEAREVILSVESAALHSPAAFDFLMLKASLFLSEEGGEESLAVLEQAARLLPSRDYVDTAGVMSFRARLARRKGDFEGAARIAREAIGIFETNNDYAHELLPALYEQQALALLLKAQDEGHSSSDEFALLCDVALDSLTRAQKLCEHQNSIRPLGRIHYLKGRWYLYLDQLERARKEAHLALETARRTDDHIAGARVRILLCQCARAQHAPAEAAQLAMEAYAEAEKTNNRRLRVRALIWRAMTEADPPRSNYEAARKLADEATRLLRPTDRDYVRWEFSDLEAHLKAARLVDNHISLPVLTINDVLSDGGLDRTLDRLEAAIVEAVVKRTGSINRTAHYLRVGRSRLKKVLRANMSETTKEKEPIDDSEGATRLRMDMPHEQPRSVLRDATDEESLRIAIQDSFQVNQPNLYGALFEPREVATGLRSSLKGFPAILAHECQGFDLTVHPQDILHELHRLLAHENLQTSEPQRKLLAFSVVVCLLQRPQLCLTNHIREFCGFHPNTNISVHMSHLLDSLKQCYQGPYAGVRITFKKGTDKPYTPHFGYQIERPMIDSDDSPKPPVMRRQFNALAYTAHLASAIMAGQDVEIYTLTGELTTSSDDLVRAVRESRHPTSLTIHLLDPKLASATQRSRIQNSWSALRTWERAGGKVSFRLLSHSALSLDVELALIGDSELLVAPLEATPVTFYEIRNGDAFFDRWSSHITSICKSLRQPQDASA
jgi:tetratricopeptide (TPR) repeat protein